MTSTSARIARTAAIVAGGAWFLDTLIITLTDSSFGLPDSVLFLTGLVGMFVAAGAAGYAWRRVPGAVVGVVVGYAVASGVALGVQAIVDALYNGHNQGMNNEIGLMVAGAAAFVIGLRAPRLPARPTFRSRVERDPKRTANAA